MTNQHLEPTIRLAIGNMRYAATYIHRLPGSSTSVSAALSDLSRAIAHLEKYAEKKRVVLRKSMKT